ncbi:MAG: B12-binding domain-containing radical SAM protein [Deltaproteobacteria bacterium]|nr:B12-binding domain-containing radical SAM protein [Deltaproteobacteria bacterium]
MPVRKVVLINPRCPADFLNSSVINQALGKTTFFPSLSLLTIAALTPKEQFEVEIFDEYLGKSVEEAVPDADIYGMTCYDPNRGRAHEICRWLKARGKFVVLGGPHASQHFRAIAEDEPYDVVFAGDAELTWPRFLSEWLQGAHQPLYVEEEKVDLKHTPVASWDMVPRGRYLSALLQTTRGCPYRCDFCDAIVLYGNKVRTKPVDKVIEELDLIYKAGFQTVFLGDDNFTAARGYAKQVLRRVAEWRKDKDPLFVLGTQLSIDIARDDELLELMTRAGLVFVYLGIESSSEDALRHANKLQNLKSDMRADVEKLHSYGINVMSGLIVGFDQDGPDIFGRHAEFCEELGIPACVSYILTAPYGTPLRKRLEEEGRIDGDYTLGELLKTNIIPKRMSAADLMEGYRWMTTRLFEYDGFVRRLKKKYGVFRAKGIATAGTMTAKIRARHYLMGWRILAFMATHPGQSRDLAALFAKVLPVMLERPAFINDIFLDLMIFIRFKTYYDKTGVYSEDLRQAPDPGTWIKEQQPPAAAPLPLPPDAALPVPDPAARPGIATA